MAESERQAAGRDGDARSLLSSLARREPAVFPHGRVEVLDQRERLGSRVLRLRLGSGAESCEAFLKVCRLEGGGNGLARRIRDDLAQQKRAHQAMRSISALGVARPLWCDPAAHLSLVEAARGTTLDVCIRNHPAACAPALERAGRWLRAFHRALPATGRIPLESIRAYVDLRLRWAMERGRAFGPDQRRHVLARFDALAAEVDGSELAPVPIHGDFSLENVLVDGDRVTAIDFDVGAGTRGARYHDVAYLYAGLERLRAKPWLRRRDVERLQRALLAGFDPTLDDRRPLFRLMLLQHVACRLAQGAVARGRVRAAFDAYGWRHCLRCAGL